MTNWNDIDITTALATGTVPVQDAQQGAAGKPAQALIRLRYESVDGANKLANFKTLKGARNWATLRVGPNPDMGLSYAVSDDGVGKVTVVEGTTLGELFAPEPPAEPKAPKGKGAGDAAVGATVPALTIPADQVQGGVVAFDASVTDGWAIGAAAADDEAAKLAEVAKDIAEIAAKGIPAAERIAMLSKLHTVLTHPDSIAQCVAAVQALSVTVEQGATGETVVTDTSSGEPIAVIEASAPKPKGKLPKAPDVVSETAWQAILDAVRDACGTADKRVAVPGIMVGKLGGPDAAQALDRAGWALHTNLRGAKADGYTWRQDGQQCVGLLATRKAAKGLGVGWFVQPATPKAPAAPKAAPAPKAPKAAKPAKAAAPAPAPAPKAPPAGTTLQAMPALLKGREAWAYATAAAAEGVLPAQPDFTAETHARYRARLAKLVELQQAGDIAGLKAITIKAADSSTIPLARFRDLSIQALEIQASKGGN